ncbi:MAG: glycosyl transferase family 90 [Pseudomonadota bacterium]
MSADAFIEREIRHRLGTFGAQEPVFDGAALSNALDVSSGMTLAWSASDHAPYALNGWRDSGNGKIDTTVQGNPHKTQGALDALLAAGADFDFLLDMQDHRARRIGTEGGGAPPLFTFNRRADARDGRILWPLPTFHDIGSPEFLGGLDPETVPWAEKADRIVWRGGAGNRGRLGKYGRGAFIRMLPLLRRHADGDLSGEDTLRALRTMPRYKLLERYFDDPRFDVGYTETSEIPVAGTALLQRFAKAPLPRTAFQHYKYILVLPGSDVGSSLYWTLNSGSIALVMECDFETFGTCHFRPWEHYVPIQASLRGIEKALAWCTDHPEACQAMAARAGEVCRQLGDPELRRRTNAGVVAGVAAALGKTRSFPAGAFPPPARARPPEANAKTPELTIFFIAQPPAYQNMGVYLAASVRAMYSEPVDLVGYVPESAAAALDPKALALYRKLDVDIRVFDDADRFAPAYPHGNKILAALEPRRTPYSAFLDSDMLMIRPNRIANLIRPGHVSVAPATSMYWTGQKIWDEVYEACGMAVPEARIWLSRQRRRQLLPYFNAGLVAFPEGPVAPDGRSFAEIWHDLAQAIDRRDIPKKRPYLDQLSLPPAILSAGLNWNILPEEQHYILGGALRGAALPADREIVLLHYRNFRNLRDVGHLKTAKSLLQRATGVRRIGQVAAEGALTDG